MSQHFKWSLYILSIICALLLTAFFWIEHKLNKVIRLPSISTHSGLRSDERELVMFNEKTHHVTVITSSATLKMYARNPTVRIKKDGSVTVDRHLLGFEAKPFIGVGYSDTTRGMIGVAPAYWGAFDVSMALGISLDKQYVFAKPYVAIGYNCWDNLSINAGVNPVAIKQLDVILFMSVKL